MCNLYTFVASSLKRFIILSLGLCLPLFLACHASADPHQKSQNVAVLNHPPITEGWEPIEEKASGKTIATPDTAAQDTATQNTITQDTAARDATLDPSTSEDKEARNTLTAMTKIRASLTDTDYVAALQAIHFALSQVGDGKKYVWHTSQNLRGQIEPTYVFRDTDGRICRHVIYTLYISRYSKSIEAIACRTLSGRWDLSG